MNFRALAFSIFGVMLALTTLTMPAHAQATRTWVSGVGDDANPCSRTAPCKTFAGAISKTAAGGEINCIDPGGFGAVTITKAMTIDCANIEAGVVVAGTNGVIVNAGASDVVVLRGLDLMGTVAAPGLNGIRFIAGGALHVEKCLIREFTSAAPNGVGILFQPAAASKLFVSDTILTNNSNGGIVLRATGTGAATATVWRTSAGNGSGFTVDTAGGPSSATSLMTVRESVASGNTLTGFSVTAGAATGFAGLLIDRSSATLNGTGVNASGNAAALAGSATIWGNGAGLTTSSGGQVQTFGNNQMFNSGTFATPVLPLQ